MIMHALASYYDRLAEEGIVAQEGFQRAEIPFLIILNPGGEFVSLQDTRNPSGKKLVARTFVVPKERGRAGPKAWQTSNLLWDHYGYILAWPKADGNEHREMARKQHITFVAETKKLHERYPHDREIRAVINFLENRDFSKVLGDPLWDECAKIAGCNLTFRIAGQTQLICQNENVKDFVHTMFTSTSNDEDGNSLSEVEGICLVSGVYAPVARLNPRTPIRGAKANAKIVSFQKNMGFDSYAKLQSYNAPISRRVAFAYTTALNEMIAKGSRQKLLIGDDTVVFWAEKKHDIENVFADLFGEPAKGEPEPDYKSIVAMFCAPATCATPHLDPNTRFYVLGLSPNAARVAVRYWYTGTVREVADNILLHFNDLEIVKSTKEWRSSTLRNLLRSTALLGKDDNVPPNLAGDTMKAILAGTPYPQTLLSAAVRRCRAEQSKRDPKTGKLLENIHYTRAAIIKAVLVRDSRFGTRFCINHEKEVGMSLDLENTNVGYRLGRLFATLEKVQEEANPGINATIRDRFYGSASATPVTAFPHLMKLKNHHLSKLENRGRAVNLEKMIGEIIDGVSDFPAQLSLADQGRFAVGYYHQRQAFFVK
jgi:CRISPR-associated protein Csd1